MLYACWYKCCISVGTNVVQVLVQVLYTCWYKCCTRVGTSVVSGKYVLICTTLFQFGCDQPLMWLQSVQWLRHKTSSGWPFPLWSDLTTTLRWTVNCRVRMSLNSCVQWDIWMMTSFNYKYQMLWCKPFFSSVKNRSCVTQICITKIAAKCILVVVVKWRHRANVQLRDSAQIFRL